jgi:hypothetical protein
MESAGGRQITHVGVREGDDEMPWQAILNLLGSRISFLGGMLLALAFAGASEVAHVKELAPGSSPAHPGDPTPAEEPEGPSAGPQEANEGPEGSPGPRIEAGAVTLTPQTPAVTGAQVTLEIDREPMEGSRFYWTQVEGPPVTIDDPSGPSIRVTIPPGANRLGFVFVASSRSVVRVVRLSLPIQGARSEASSGVDTPREGGVPATGGLGKVRADAGDDQVGLVGHRVTLNGTRSVPEDGKAARWIQVSGPPTVAPQQQGMFYSFIPGGPGAYRFMLVVAAGGEISEPDEVSVLVGSPPTAPTSDAASTPSVAPSNAPSPASPPATATPDQILSRILPHLPGSPRVASDVADVLEAIAERAALYSSFGSLQNELSRRLDIVVPTDPAQRASWIQGVFLPLTAVTAGELLATGLDIRIPQGVHQPLTPAQQDRVRDHFQKLARAFRAMTTAR